MGIVKRKRIFLLVVVIWENDKLIYLVVLYSCMNSFLYVNGK